MDINSEDFNKIAKIIASKYQEYKEIVIINVGTDLVVGDSFGPLVGTMIEENRLNNFYSYGNLDNPITALNLKDEVKKIKAMHPNAYLIGIDACVSKTEEKLNTLMFRLDKPLCPGSGAGKVLIDVGDSSIVFILKEPIGKSLSMVLRQDRLRNVYHSARKVISLLTEANELIDLKLGEGR